MVTYDLTLERQHLSGAEKFSIAANANETVCLRFYFDRSWRRFDSKAAVFKNQRGKFYVIEIIENRVKVPWEVLTDVGNFELSLIGYEGTSVLSSDKAEIYVSESLLPEECRTFSPSEVLFDRFKKECIAEAELDYKDEINALKKANAEAQQAFSDEISKMKKEKEAEISALENEHRSALNELNSQLNELQVDFNSASEKAEKWDMVDFALGIKNRSTAVWSSGSQPFALPMMNTSLISTFTASMFSPKLKSIGLDLSSAQTFVAVFRLHEYIEELTLKNTDNITSFESLFEGSNSIRRATFGNISNCRNFLNFAYDASCLEKISFSGILEPAYSTRMFSDCLALKEINGLIGMSYAVDIDNMFLNCTSLVTVSFVENSIRKDFDLVSCISLSQDSLWSVARGLSDEIGGELIIAAYAFNKNFPTAEQQNEYRAFVTETKGWDLTVE